jgi:hypothetical protein
MEVLFNYLPCEWQRQAATKFPGVCIYFYYADNLLFLQVYKRWGNRRLLTAASGITAMGLIHTIALAFAG